MIYILLLSHVVKYCYCLAVYGCGFLTLPLTGGVLGGRFARRARHCP